MALTLDKLSRKSLAAGANGKTKTSRKRLANKPAASALPLRVREEYLEAQPENY